MALYQKHQLLPYLNKQILLTEENGLERKGLLHHINDSHIEVLLDDGVNYILGTSFIAEIQECQTI